MVKNLKTTALYSIAKMPHRIHVSNVHKAIELSVPYDLAYIVHSFYTFYSTLPVEGENGENIWGQEYTKQQRFMTPEQVFKCLNSFTENLSEQDIDAVRGRMIGHLASLSSIPYNEIETYANTNLKLN